MALTEYEGCEHCEVCTIKSQADLKNQITHLIKDLDALRGEPGEVIAIDNPELDKLLKQYPHCVIAALIYQKIVNARVSMTRR